MDRLAASLGAAAQSFRMDSGLIALLLGPGIALPWLYMLFRPPPPKICGTRNGPPVTADRIRLRDGRYLAYKEAGVPKDQARFKLVYSHQFSGCRHSFPSFSEELLKNLGVYIVAFDRAGYGESDPFPKRSIKSQAEDIEQLVDQLQLGDKFHLLALSMGCYSAWACLKYIPNRLAGVAMMAPVVNYWWPRADKEVLREAFQTQCLGDRITLNIAHYAPWLLHFWLTNNSMPSSVNGGIEKYLNKMDLEIMASVKPNPNQKEALQQGVYESLHRDIMIQFGKWDFYPGDIPDPGVPVYVWQGNEDYLVPVVLQRHIAKSLPWIKYRELPGVGHMLDLVPGVNDKVLSSLLTGNSSCD